MVTNRDRKGLISTLSYIDQTINAFQGNEGPLLWELYKKHKDNMWPEFFTADPDGGAV